MLSLPIGFSNSIGRDGERYFEMTTFYFYLLKGESCLSFKIIA